MLAFLLVLSFRSVAADEPTPLDPGIDHVCKSDILFFFESVSYDHGKWHFELARNSMGMLWRTVSGDKDVTGVCSYKQTLVVPGSAFFEIKNKDLTLSFQPTNTFEGPLLLYVSMQIGAKDKYITRSRGKLELYDSKWNVVPIPRDGSVE